MILIHSFHSADLPEHILCADHYSRHREYGRDQEKQGPCPQDTHILVEELEKITLVFLTVFVQESWLKYQFTKLLQLSLKLAYA